MNLMSCPKCGARTTMVRFLASYPMDEKIEIAFMCDNLLCETELGVRITGMITITVSESKKGEFQNAPIQNPKEGR